MSALRDRREVPCEVGGIVLTALEHVAERARRTDSATRPGDRAPSRLPDPRHSYQSCERLMCHFWYNSNRQMLPPPAQDPAVYAIVGAAGVALIVLTRWAARRGGRWRSWIALSIGDLRFTEVVGAFLIGASLGGLLAPQLDAGGVTGPPRPMGPAGRFGSFNWSRLALIFRITAAV